MVCISFRFSRIVQRSLSLNCFLLSFWSFPSFIGLLYCAVKVSYIFHYCSYLNYYKENHYSVGESRHQYHIYIYETYTHHSFIVLNRNDLKIYILDLQEGNSEGLSIRITKVLKNFDFDLTWFLMTITHFNIKSSIT